MKALQHIWALLTSRYLLFVVVAAQSVGIYYARSLVSIATGILFGVGLLALTDPGRRQRVLGQKESGYLMLIFLIYLASVLMSQDKSTWVTQLNIGLPYLAVPLGMIAFREVIKAEMVRLFAIFIGVTVLSTLIISFDYLTHLEHYNSLYKVGQTIPTPILHVRYSYFVALACSLCIGLLFERIVADRKWQLVLKAVALFLFLFLHVLAVRTGLFACYVAILAMAWAYAIRRRKWQTAVAGTIGALVIMSLAYLLLPSLRNKIDYMKHDLKMMVEHGALPQYSDNTRIVSYLHGLGVFTEDPIAGAGIGDVAGRVEMKYQTLTPQFPPERRYLPESDYVYWLASFGLVGTILLLGLLCYPLLLYWKSSYVIVALYAVTLASSLGVTTLQLQLGKTTFLLLLCIVLHYCRTQMVGKPVVTPVGSAGNNLVQ